jgi:hypothetical protein
VPRRLIADMAVAASLDEAVVDLLASCLVTAVANAAL